MLFTPRAWSAQYASRAGEAESAGTASFASSAGSAQSAAVAGTLAGSSTIELQLVNGYTNYGNTYDVARATRVGNMVYLSGLGDESGVFSGSVFAELPEEFRPIGRHLFIVPNSIFNSQIRVDVLPSGSITRITGGGLDWFSLTGISYPVAP